MGSCCTLARRRLLVEIRRQLQRQRRYWQRQLAGQGAGGAPSPARRNACLRALATLQASDKAITRAARATRKPRR